MTTIYEETPTFEERVEGAPLIIEGRVEKIVDVKVDHSGDQPQVQTVFRVNVNSVLKGQTVGASVNIRVVGGRVEKMETSWSVRMKEGDRVLLMAAPDYGSDHGENIFVPYFSTCYPVTAKGEVKLDTDTEEELAIKKIQIEKATAKLADMRSMISTVIQRQEQKATILAEMEPAEFRETPYGEVAEMPHSEPGGATPSSPEGEFEGPKETD